MSPFIAPVLTGDLVTEFGGLGKKKLTPYPTTPAALNVIFEFKMAEASLKNGAFHLNVHSVTGNVRDKE